MTRDQAPRPKAPITDDVTRTEEAKRVIVEYVKAQQESIQSSGAPYNKATSVPLRPPLSFSVRRREADLDAILRIENCLGQHHTPIPTSPPATSSKTDSQFRPGWLSFSPSAVAELRNAFLALDRAVGTRARQSQESLQSWRVACDRDIRLVARKHRSSRQPLGFR